jgi:glycosyltransferase involved in cell wall biosynthesis
MNLKVLFFAYPEPNISGGTRRSYEVLNRISKYDIEPIVVIDDYFPISYNFRSPIKCIHISNFFSKFFKLSRNGSLLDDLGGTAMIISDPFKVISVLSTMKEVPDLIVSHHEDPCRVLSAYIVGARLGLPWTAILQSTHLQGGKTLLSKILSKTTILQVSKSIEYDIGFPYSSITLNPGVGLDHELIMKSKSLEQDFDGLLYARLAPEKGIFDVLQIWYYVTEKKPDAKLIVTGQFVNESVKSRFFKLQERLNLKKNVIYLGFLEHKKLYGYVKSSKILIYPSRLDSISLVVLESLACGLPVVAYDILANKINFPIESVVRVPVGDVKLAATEVLNLLGDEQRRTILSRSAIAFSKRFTWDLAAKSEANAYTEILKGHQLNNPINIRS